jgi:SAM-dependent methyltransferase
MMFLLTVLSLIILSTLIIEALIYRNKPNAPFVSIPDSFLDFLVTHIPIQTDSVVYDLGSDDGKVLRALYEYNKKGKYIGIERSFFPYYMSLFKQRHISKNDISFVRGDFFNTNISEANSVVMYLFPKLMDALLPKLRKELKPETRVYSIDFQFSGIKPVSTYARQNLRPKERGRVIYVYQF